MSVACTWAGWILRTSLAWARTAPPRTRTRERRRRCLHPGALPVANGQGRRRDRLRSSQHPTRANVPDSNQYAVGSRVRVNLNCNFSLITPFLSSVIGDGAGHISVGSSAVFMIRAGSVDGVIINNTSSTPTPSATPTATSTTVSTPTPTPTDTPTPTPTPTSTGSSAAHRRRRQAPRRRRPRHRPGRRSRSPSTAARRALMHSGGGLRIYRREPDRRHPANRRDVRQHVHRQQPPRLRLGLRRWQHLDSCGNNVTHTYTRAARSR